MKRALLALSVFLAVVASGARAASFQSVIEKKDIDAANCASFFNGAPTPLPAEKAAVLLGATKGDFDWNGGRVANGGTVVKGTADTFAYRVAFTKPIAIGTLFASGDFNKAFVLKSDAPFPGDPAVDAHWQALDVLPRQSGAKTVTPDAVVETRAILLVDRKSWGHSKVRAIRIFSERLHNITPWALAYADREYYKPPADFSHDFLYAAALVTRGEGPWLSSGKNREGRIPTPQVTDVTPNWFMVTWPEAQTIQGFWMDTNVQQFELEQFVGPARIHPRAGTADEWKLVRDVKVVDGFGRWVTFAPLSTRGLRLRITKTGDPNISSINGFHTFVSLDAKPAPRGGYPQLAEPDPPKEIPFTLDDDGQVTIAINRPDGRRVRNVIARVDRKKGENSASWDLRDEYGIAVEPGTYKWVGLTYPRLQPKYLMTAYPNISTNSPQNSSWLNGHSGPGGWMADHAGCTSVTAIGDRIFLGSQTSESGVSLIECDMTGAKQWGFHSFAAWTGVSRMAATETTLYCASPFEGGDAIWAVDIQSKKVTQFLHAGPTVPRQRGMRSIAAAGDTLYMAVNAPSPALNIDVATRGDIDIVNCVPRYPKVKPPKVNNDIPPDPQADFVKLFRIGGPIPGGCCSALDRLSTEKGVGRRQHMVLAFNKSMAIGSLAFPLPSLPGTQFRISFAKANAPYPPDPETDSQWLPLRVGKEPWQVIALPEGAQTRALRISFVKGGGDAEDSLSNLIETVGDADLGKKNSDAGALAGGGGEANPKDMWAGTLDGMRLMRVRFAGLSEGLTVRTNSGAINAAGEWDAKRTEPLTEKNPGIYLMEYAKPQPVRGVMIKEIDGSKTKIDVYTGPDGAIDLAGTEGWETVAEFKQKRRFHYQPDENNNSDARYVDSYVDFGKEINTRAVRLRVIEQWFDGGNKNLEGVRRDRGGVAIDPKRCRVYGAMPVKNLGGETPADPLQTQRLEIYDTKTAKLKAEFHVPKLEAVALNAKGELYGMSRKAIFQIDPTTGKCRDVVTDLIWGRDIAFDAEGNIYAGDTGKDRDNIRVYSPDGKLLRTIGKPGGLQVGPWDPQRMLGITDLEIDKKGQLWVVEEQYYPKRVTLWSINGTFKTEFLGNTEYGGGGKLDSEDLSRIVYGPMEFELDWATGKTRLKNILTMGVGDNFGDIAMHRDGKTYLVNHPRFLGSSIGIVSLLENGKLRRVAAVGIAGAFPPLKTSDMVAAFGGISLAENRFIWADRNGDGEVQVEEVKLTPKGAFHSLTNFSQDFGVQAGQLRYEVKEWLPNGTPVYEEKMYDKLPAKGVLYRLANGNFYRVGLSEDMREGVITPDGKEVWSFKQDGTPNVQALHNAPPWRPEQVVAQLGIIGHEPNPGHPLGEFVVLSANTGAWNIWTVDGLLVGPIWRDKREKQAKPWSMREHESGMVLENVFPGEEHFSGHFVRGKDGKYYIVAGHNHISVCEILGFDKFKRIGGEITVTSEDLKKLQAWETDRQKTDVYMRAPVVDCYRAKRQPTIDGQLNDWDEEASATNEEIQFRMCYDDHRLYLAFKAQGHGPFKNSGEQWDRLFKTGAAVDLQIGADPAADPNRGAPAAGDVRFLMALMKGQPAGVLYRAVVPGTPAEKVWRVVSPVFEVKFDDVAQAKDMKMAVKSGEDGYTVEASIPLAELGLKPSAGSRFKMDWGVLTTGPDGNEVMRRIYWSNKATAIVSDAPSEARLHPDLWGYVLFHGARESLAEQAAPGEGLKPASGGKKKKAEDLDDLIDDLRK